MVAICSAAASSTVSWSKARLRRWSWTMPGSMGLSWKTEGWTAQKTRSLTFGLRCMQ